MDGANRYLLGGEWRRRCCLLAVRMTNPQLGCGLLSRLTVLNRFRKILRKLSGPPPKRYTSCLLIPLQALSSGELEHLKLSPELLASLCTFPPVYVAVGAMV